MADNTASLVVALSAQLTKFEKDMRAAGIMADKGVKDIEDKFSKLNPQVNASFLGNLFSNIVTKGIESATRALTEFYARFSDLQKQARILDVSMADVWGFQEAAKKGGAAIEDSTASLRRLASLLAEMQRGDKNTLSALFDANPEALKGINRQTLTIQQTWQIIANLIADTNKGVEKIEVGRLAGQSEAMALALDKAGRAFSGMQQSAAEAAPPLNRMAEEAKLFESYMAKSWEWMKGISAIAIRGVGSALAAPTAYTDEQVEALRAKQSQALKPGSQSLKSEAQRAEDRAKGRAFGTMSDEVKPAGPGTQLPRQAVAGGGRDEFERANDQITKHIALMNADTAAAGANIGEKERMRTEATLMEAMRRKLNIAEGEAIPLTEAQTEKIKAQADAAAKASMALAEAQHKIAQLNSAAQTVGSAVSTAFADAIIEGKKLDEVLQGLVKTLLKAALNATIMNIFTPGAGGGLASIFKFAEGTNSAPGGMALVGEKGPELVNLPRGSQVIPNNVTRGMMGGGGAITYAPAIDARGASVEAVARLAQIMEADRAAFTSRTIAVIQHARRGRVPGV